MIEEKKLPKAKKKSQAVTSKLGDKLMLALSKASEITGQPQAELVRCVFSRYAPTEVEIASAYLEREIAAQKAKLAALQPYNPANEEV